VAEVVRQADGRFRLRGVPIFRDIVGHYAGGKDYEMSPVAALVHNTDRLLADLKDGSTHERWIKHAMTEAGYILGMPWASPAPQRSSWPTCGTASSTPRTSPSGGAASPPGT
jgi:hypothetical protein